MRRSRTERSRGRFATASPDCGPRAAGPRFESPRASEPRNPRPLRTAAWHATSGRAARRGSRVQGVFHAAKPHGTEPRPLRDRVSRLRTSGRRPEVRISTSERTTEPASASNREDSPSCAGARPLQRSERRTWAWRPDHTPRAPPVIGAPGVPTSEDVGHPRSGTAFGLHSRVIDGTSANRAGARPLQRSERRTWAWRPDHTPRAPPVIGAPGVPTSEDVGHPRSGTAFGLHSRVIDGTSANRAGARPLQRSERGAWAWRPARTGHSPVTDTPCASTPEDVGHPRPASPDAHPVATKRHRPRAGGVGVERSRWDLNPRNNGFAIRPLRPLGYATSGTAIFAPIAGAVNASGHPRRAIAARAFVRDGANCRQRPS